MTVTQRDVLEALKLLEENHSLREIAEGREAAESTVGALHRQKAELERLLDARRSSRAVLVGSLMSELKALQNTLSDF